jgi:uncharacterized protein
MINMLAKKHEIDNKMILAVCDEELIGKEYEDGKIFFKVSERFYKGKKVNEKELEELLIETDSANFFGNKCVKMAEKKGLINERQIIIISGIKHAQIYKV